MLATDPLTVPERVASTQAETCATPFARPAELPAPPDVGASAPAASDCELMARMAGGDERAMRTLVASHGATVFSLAQAILRERSDAEEVAADAFMQAWRSAATFDPARSSVVAWLGMIARSRALDRLRARARRGKHRAQDTDSMAADEPELTLPDPDTPDRAMESREARALVAGAVRELPESQRHVIELAYFGGLSQSEIAERLSIPLGTVKTRTLAAMRQLRSRLGPLLREEVA